MLRPDVSLEAMANEVSKIKEIINIEKINNIQQAEIQIKYASYIDKEEELATKMSAMENLLIPETFDYNKLVALGTEARQKFTKVKPRTIGQASRISGVNPTDIQILMVHIGR